SVIITVRAVGLILVIALMSIPTYMAEKLSSSLYKMMLISIFLTIFFTVIGLLFSYFFDISSGATIILIASIAFFIFLFVMRMVKSA
ncbi:MAG: metal ABC transporter permease, partial [Epsilonproteobacteria bacterium]|nr:metal ABC transporter permease [Campylobacterota bacterium]